MAKCYRCFLCMTVEKQANGGLKAMRKGHFGSGWLHGVFLSIIRKIWAIMMMAMFCQNYTLMK